MWTVVYIAANRALAEMIKELLSGDGFLVMLRPIGPPHLGDSSQYEILVPETELDEVHEILTTVLGCS